ncbi:hypothetical protein B0H11DRAFT_2231585 [Mycena galericulata]|nr:hypothetical protein B0H11DRAFT_2231585 [Mycena galericulata]
MPGLYMIYSEHKPLWFFGWDGVGGMACQAIKMACKPIGRAWAGDHTQIHAPAPNKPFRAGASHSAKPKMSLSFDYQSEFGLYKDTPVPNPDLVALGVQFSTLDEFLEEEVVKRF